MSLPPSRLTRRRLLQAIMAGSAAMTLAGCNTLATMPSLGGVTGRITGSDRRFRVNEKMGQRPWSPDDQQQSDRGRRLVDAARSGRPVPLVTHELAHADRLPEVERDWTSLVASAEQSGRTNLNQHLSMSMLLAPIIAQKWMQEDPELMHEMVGDRQPALRGDVIDVPPGTMVKARFKGSCMDDKMPAPSRGEALTVRPIDGYIHPQLEGLNAGVSRLRGNDEISYEDFQHLVWAIRNAGQKENTFLDNLQPRHVEQLNRAAPGGHRTLMATHVAEAHNPLNDLTTGLLSEFNQRFQLNLNGQSFGPAELFERFAQNGAQGGTEQAVSLLLGALTSQEADGPVPGGEERGFSMLNDHVAVKATAADRLDPELWIINAGVEPFVFDPTRYVLESPRDTQRVGLPSRPIPGHFDGRSIPMEANDELGRLGERFVKDLKIFGIETMLREAVDMRSLANHEKLIKTPVGAWWTYFQTEARAGGQAFRSGAARELAQKFGRFVPSPEATRLAFRHGADYLPIIGNMLSLYELVAGHHLLERDNPSSNVERGLAAIGVIPGGKAVAGIGRTVMASQRLREATNDLSRRAAVLLRNYSQNSAVRGLEETAIMRDIAWWMVSDAHEVLAEEVDYSLDNRFTGPWNETIAYVRSL